MSKIHSLAHQSANSETVRDVSTRKEVQCWRCAKGGREGPVHLIWPQRPLPSGNAMKIATSLMPEEDIRIYDLMVSKYFC
jgi:hypothetical protein